MSNSCIKNGILREVGALWAFKDCKFRKIVKVFGKRVKSVMDSGNDLRLIRGRAYFLFGALEMLAASCEFDEIGLKALETWSACIPKVEINDVFL